MSTPFQTRLRLFIAAAAVGGIVALVACSTESTTPSTPAKTFPPAQSTSKEITAAAGGQVTLSTGVVLDIPAGALPADTKVTVTETEPDKIAATSSLSPLVGRPVVFTPHGLTFKQPVTLTLPYTSGATKLAVIKLADDKATKWSQVPSGTFEGGKAKFQITGFSIYGVAELKPDDTCPVLCSKISACLKPGDDCANKGCPEAALKCPDAEWKALIACINSSTSCDDADKRCIKTAPCLAEDNGGSSSGGSSSGGSSSGGSSSGGSSSGGSSSGGVDAGGD